MLQPVPRLRLPTLRPPSPQAAGRLVVGLLLLLVGAEAVRVTLGGNRHEVIPGKVYRTAQLSGDTLRRVIRDDRIRTVVNLRGFSPLSPVVPDWYRDEAAVCHESNVSLEDLTFSANRLPPPAELRRLIDVFDRTEYPVLFHCKQGADRTGLAATIALLLYSDATLDRARRQLLPRYGHVRFGRTAVIDEFFDRYQAWLESRSEAHTPARFRDWALHHYRPGPGVGGLALREPVPAVAAGKPFAVKVTAVNRAAEPWEMRPGNYAGIHVSFTVSNDRGQPVHAGQAGLIRRTVWPGESIDLDLVVPPLPAGVYTLRADLIDARGAGVPVRTVGFYQLGSDPLMAAVEIKP